MTPEEFADRKRISVRTVYRLIQSGKVKAERVGRQYRIWVGHPVDTTLHDTTANK